MPRKELGTGPISAQAQQDLVSDGIENFELPKSLVTKIAKSAVPETTKLQKESVLSLVKGSTVFINYLTATAHDVAVSKQHKSISASDILKALEMIEFSDLVDKLQNELAIYRQISKSDKTKPHRPSVSGPSSAPGPGPGTAAGPTSSASLATSSKSKGKEKEKPTQGALAAGAALPPPFTSAPLHGYSGSSISTAGASVIVRDRGGGGDDVDWEAELGEAADASTTAPAAPAATPTKVPSKTGHTVKSDAAARGAISGIVSLGPRMNPYPQITPILPPPPSPTTTTTLPLPGAALAPVPVPVHVPVPLASTTMAVPSGGDGDGDLEGDAVEGDEENEAGRGRVGDEEDEAMDGADDDDENENEHDDDDVDVDVDEDEDGDEGGGEENVDMMDVEEQELKKDGRGLEGMEEDRL